MPAMYLQKSKRRGSGTNLRVHGPGIRIRDSLIRAIEGEDYGKPPPRKKVGRKIWSTRTTFTDAVVLQVRALHEFRGMSFNAIASKLQAEGVPILARKVYEFCDYRTRVHLVPTQANCEVVP